MTQTTNAYTDSAYIINYAYTTDCITFIITMEGFARSLAH